MESPRLTDFSHDQQLIALRALMDKKFDLEDHLRGLKIYPSLAGMMEKEILYFQSQVDDLDLLITQFSSSLRETIYQEKIRSN